MQRQEEVLPSLFAALLQIGLQLLVTHHDVLLTGKAADAHHQVGRIHKVDGEHAEKNANDKGKRQIAGKPVQRPQDVRVDKKVVRRPHPGPDGGKQRADQPVDIAPAPAVIPQAGLHHLQQQDTGQILDAGHRRRHQQQHQNVVPQRAGQRVSFRQAGNQVQDAQSAAVQRDVRPYHKAGVDPLAFRVVTGKEASEQKLQHPSQHRTDEKEKSQL